MNQITLKHMVCFLLSSFNCFPNNFLFYSSLGRTFVDYVQDKNGVIVTSDPEILKKVLLKDFQIFSHRIQAFYTQPYARKAVMFRDGTDWKR